jgi:small neutral amino acid transporter SnatA (MarC family)
MRSSNPYYRGYAAVIGFVAAVIAGVVGLVVAIALALSVVVIGLFGGILLACASLAMRARRSSKKAKAEGDSQIIEAQRVGGHSWVAYGWDNRQ